MSKKSAFTEINGNFDLLVDRDGAKITIRDEDANITLVEVSVSAEKFCAALSRLIWQDCKVKLGPVEHAGKRYEHDSLEFPLPEGKSHFRNQEMAKELAPSFCPEGWEVSLYFNSQDSFFTKDGRDWARCKIYRWVDKEEATHEGED